MDLSQIKNTKKFEDILKENSCYEQHIVSVKDFYENYLFSLITPPIYEGFLSLYKQAQVTENKFKEQAKINPKVIPKHILIYFEELLKDIPKLNTHIMKTETERIKATCKNSDIFDDLVKAVVRSNIILLTYNTDSDRQNILDSRFHENIVITDFIHNCYISTSYVLFTCSNLFYHNFEPQILNQNKLTIYSIIEKGIKEAIRNSLPMKEILLNYNTQKYERKKEIIEEKPYLNIDVIENETSKKDDFIELEKEDLGEEIKKEIDEIVQEKKPDVKMVNMSGLNSKGNLKYFFNEQLNKKKLEVVRSEKVDEGENIVNDILEV